MTLSPQQRAAVERDAPSICVVAGPGSGKTRVLIERFAWLVEQRGVDPGRILALTFTEKAANEMKQRLAARFSHSAALREKVETAWLSTIDAFCARLLAENAIAAGLPPDFTVLDPAQAERWQREAAEEALDELFAERAADMRRLMEALDLSTQDDGPQPDLARSLLDVYETMRLSGARELPAAAPPPDVLPQARALAQTIQTARGLTGQDAPVLLDWVERFLALPATLAREHLDLAGGFSASLGKLSRKNAGYPAARQLKNEVLPALEAQWVAHWHAGLPELLRTALTRLDRRFREKKRTEGSADFADLEEKTIQLLESDPEVSARVALQFDHVLMDELQDTNRLQWRLINLVRRRSFFAVGDVNQSIYGFRHADRTVFEEHRTQAQVEELVENYRSRGEILDAVSSILEGQEGVEPRPLEARREFTPARAPVVERMVGEGDHAIDAEAALVAARIREWVDSGERKYQDFAILVRTLASTPPFEQALDRLQIPFLVSGGRTFFEARETRDLMALLAALANPLDEIALVAVLRSPLAGWSDEQILRASHEGWQAEFEKLFGRIRKLAGFVAPDRLLAMALDECGYLAPLTARSRANVEKLLAWLRREHRGALSVRARPLAELLEDLEAFREAQAEAEAPPPEAAEAVRIMSIHAAKGLEFPVVFVSALHRGPERRTPVLLFSPDLGLGVKWRNPFTAEGVPDAAHRALAERRKLQEDAEENRLLYVAMTRAEDRLIVSYAERKQQPRAVKLVQAIPLADAPAVVPLAPPIRDHKGTDLDIILPKPALSSQYDSSAAVTSVAMFHACPRRYYLERYLGLEPTPQGPGTGAIDLGIEVHRGLAGGAVESSEALELVRVFEASDLGRRAARAARAGREFDFLLALEDVVLRGQIDLWFEEAGELILVDYKTDRDDSGASAYALQLRLYALALEPYAGRLPDHAVLVYLRSGREIEIGLAPLELEAARSAVRALAAAQNSLEFAMKAGEQCLRCPFYGGLCTPKLPGS